MPHRQCAGCGRRRPQRELVRLVARGGAIEIDSERRLGGRGVYLCPDRACGLAAQRKGALSRRLRVTAATPPDLPGRVAFERPTDACKD
ncbi:MAG: YlxR family protein [Solirubrobacteraceae bacterium]